MIDYWKLVKEYKVGDIVQRFAPGTGGFALSPFVGRVTAVHRGLGVLDVQFPYGVDRVFPDDVVAVQRSSTNWLPPELIDQTYMALDTQKAREVWASARKYWASGLPAGFYRDLAHVWSKGASEVSAYDMLWRRFSSRGPIDDGLLKQEIRKFYTVGSNLVGLRIEQHVASLAKEAAYWASSNRQYRATSGDMESRRPSCPKCASPMRKTTYKMHEGARVRLFACPKDLFLIRQDDLVGPTGESVVW